MLETLLLCFPLLGQVDTTHNEGILIPEMESEDDTLRSKGNLMPIYKHNCMRLNFILLIAVYRSFGFLFFLSCSE